MKQYWVWIVAELSLKIGWRYVVATGCIDLEISKGLAMKRLGIAFGLLAAAVLGHLAAAVAAAHVTRARSVVGPAGGWPVREGGRGIRQWSQDEPRAGHPRGGRTARAMSA